MQFKSCHLLSALILLILVASFHYQASAILRSAIAIVGNWRPIPDLKTPDVLEIAKFAVSEHKKKANAQLEFVKVVKGEIQVVEGMNYKLVVVANDAASDNTPGNYEAVVWDNNWKYFRELSSFVKVYG